jgi:hypothetical protein
MHEQQQSKLDWDISEIGNRDGIVIPQEGDSDEPTYALSPVTQALIGATVGVGINKITKSNFVEFWLRLRALDSWTGTDRVISVPDIERHVGLSTSAEKISQSKWFGNIKKLVGGQYATLREKREAEATTPSNGQGNVEIVEA